MQNKKPHNVSEKELDNLLGQAFLNLDFNDHKNQELMETISNQVLPTNTINTGLLNKAFFTKLISVIVLIAASAFIYFSYFRSNNNNQIASKTNLTRTISNDQAIETPKNETVLEVANISKTEITKPEASGIIPISAQKHELVLNEFPKHQLSNTTLFIDENKIKPQDTGYVFPKLTEKEIKETKRQKDKMINWLFKQSKDKYALIIPKAGHSIMSSIDDTAAQFFIQNMEVTNLEYRTFLFDLLIHGEKETFLKAKPYQNLWLDAPGNAKKTMMKNLYFSDKRYNDYPVVNINPEGAELYCKWLSSIDNGKIIARLPYENEWIKAAKGKNVSAVYPWPGDSIQNKYGCHLGDFCLKKQSEKLRTNMICTPKNASAYASAEFMLGDSMMTCKVSSYNPNDYGVYCMAGNVAEMVYNNKTKIVITKGGSWNSDFEQCKIYSKEELNESVKANSMTGFRPVFRISQTHLFGSIPRDNAEHGLPTLTAEEIISADKQKKKMIDNVIKKNNEKYAFIPMGSFLYKKDTFSVQAFYMQTTEVSNLEYRCFLMDLLIQNRSDDYLLAKPNQEMWTTKFPYSYNVPLTELYFCHPAYDNYPVVNISRKAAKLYCNWLTVETNKILKETDNSLINDLRLPADIEWAYAASNKKNYSKYANGNEYLKDSKGKYEVNYMCFSKDQCTFDSVMNLYVPKREKQKGGKKANPTITDDGYFHTSKTKSYIPNSHGLYCMAGNVSEMVFNDKTNKPETKGGSWYSCDYYLEIDADDEYKNEINASPLIGFRPVITALIIK